MSDKAYQSLSTIRDFIRWGISLFNQHQIYYGHGTDNALSEAAYLTLHSLHLPPDFPETYFDSRLTETEKQAVANALMQRVEKRLPAPYITHEAWFMGLPFYVDERVLIPRSPVAELIAEGFVPWIDPDQVGSILDLCTGSGCIAIACASVFPEARVVGADISPEALTVAEINRQRHGLEDRLVLLESDLYENLAGERFDVIISNPPYVDEEDMASLPEEYRHEPELALAAGFDGLDLVRQMLQQALSHLNPGGILIIEVGNSAYALELAYPQVPFTWLEFEHGGEGVFLLSYEQLQQYQTHFQ